jgi:hypothetical protein
LKHDRHRMLRTAGALLAAVLLSALIAACGGSGGDATTLLRQTFSGNHQVNSGQLRFQFSLTPSGSSRLTGPISLSFGGPFQSLGQGKVPASNFTVAASGLGHSGTLGIISTGQAGYVTLQGTAYQLPAATFQRLEQSFTQLTASGGAQGGSALGKLGIDPLNWLTNPSVVGNEDVGGTSTVHIHSGIDVAKLLGDVNVFLQKASSTGLSGSTKLPSGISPATASNIASKVQNPSFDVWTGQSDKTVRRMTINLTIPVTGQISTALGGLSSVGLGLSFEYDNVNQPQTITAPSNVQPYKVFQGKITSIVSSLRSALGGAVTGTGSTGSLSPGSTTGSTTPSGSTGGSSSGAVQAYTACIQAAGSDVGKMQQCAALLSGSGK